MRRAESIVENVSGVRYVPFFTSSYVTLTRTSGLLLEMVARQFTLAWIDAVEKESRVVVRGSIALYPRSSGKRLIWTSELPILIWWGEGRWCCDVR